MWEFLDRLVIRITRLFYYSYIYLHNKHLLSYKEVIIRLKATQSWDYFAFLKVNQLNV